MPVRTFLSPNDALGFGFSGFVELSIALLLAIAVVGRAALHKWALNLVQKPVWCMLIVAVLPIALRLALLPRYPAPVPSGADDFSYILLGDTIRHFRLANPPHAMPEFFEQIFVLQRPTYSSIYPPGQGLALALGWLTFGVPWAGVLLAVGALCGLCYWMLRAWTTPAWALVGGLLAVLEFGPLSYWTNCYWGGAVSATAGCLVFGALPRLRHAHRTRDAVLLGLGLTLQMITRPYEFLLLLVCVVLFVIPSLLRSGEWRDLARATTVVAPIVASGAALLLIQNRAVTGSWTTLPYSLYRYEYGVPATFTFQPNAVPRRQLNEEQDLDYRAEVAIHGQGTDSPKQYWNRLLFRARFYRFFLLPPLYLAFLAFLASIRELRFAWVVLALVVFSLGSNFYPYFYPHYIAAATCLYVLASVAGLDVLNRCTFRGRLLPELGTLLALLCAAHFLFWYGVRAIGNERFLSEAVPYESWDFINGSDPQGRRSIENQLAGRSGRQLVIVRYGPRHMFQEWVHNAADIDHEQVVWAHDLGANKNQQLLEYYPDRTAWLLEPDATPPALTPYHPETPLLQNVQ